MDLDDVQLNFLVRFAQGEDLQTIGKVINVQVNTLRFWKSQFRIQLKVQSDIELITYLICSNETFKTLIETETQKKIKSIPHESITTFERSIIIKFIQGEKTSQIAEYFKLSENRLKDMVETIHKKLQTKTKREFVICAIALQCLKFRNNKIPYHFVENSDEIWNIYQKFLRESNHSSLLFSPLYDIESQFSLILNNSEIEILRYRLYGLSFIEIATILKITRQSITNKWRAIKKKLGCTKPGEIVKTTISSKIITKKTFNDQNDRLNEVELLTLVSLSKSKSTDEIAKLRNLKKNTIKAHIHSIKTKWGMSSIEGIIYKGACLELFDDF